MISAPGWSLTFMIDTRTEQPLANMERELRGKAVAAESGAMDRLFDEGIIFFNVNSVAGENSRSSALSLASRQGADYLLTLSPDADGIGWRLDVMGTDDAFEGFVSADETEGDTADDWASLGVLAAEEALAAMPG